MIIKDKWGNKHSVYEYDSKDLEITPPEGITFKGLIPNDQLTRSGYNTNSTSTRINERRDVVLTDLKRYKEKKKNNW